jgi:dihydrofolate synthase/folylpolyglutamate synthase
VHWPARMEVLSREPLVVTDGAHNGESALRLEVALREWFPECKWALIFGASSDKDFAAMFDALLPMTSRVILTRARTARAADPERLAELVAAHDKPVEVAESVADALDLALNEPEGGAGVIITGSLFVAAEAEAVWTARVGGPTPETDD